MNPHIHHLLLLIPVLTGCFDACPHPPCAPLTMTLDVARSTSDDRIEEISVEDLQDIIDSRPADYRDSRIGTLDTQCLAEQILHELRTTTQQPTPEACKPATDETKSLYELIVMTSESAPIPSELRDWSEYCLNSASELLTAILRRSTESSFLVSSDALAASVQENLIESHSEPELTLGDLAFGWKDMLGRYGPSNDDTGNPPGFLACFEAPLVFSAIELPGAFDTVRVWGAKLGDGSPSGAEAEGQTQPPLRQAHYQAEYSQMNLVPNGPSLPVHPPIDAMGFRILVDDGHYAPCTSKDPCPSSYANAPSWSLQYIMLDALRHEYADLTVDSRSLPGIHCHDTPGFTITNGWLEFEDGQRAPGFIWELLVHELMREYEGVHETTLTVDKTHLCERTLDLGQQVAAQLEDAALLGLDVVPRAREMGVPPFDVFYDYDSMDRGFLYGATDLDPLPAPESGACRRGQKVRFLARGDEDSDTECGEAGSLVNYHGIDRCRWPVSSDQPRVHIEICDEKVFEIEVTDADHDHIELIEWQF